MTDAVHIRIAATFNALFAASHRTYMVGGAAEPLYEPPNDVAMGRVVYTYDYPASALHEAAHWCFAGANRRRLHDYGYWYVPGPRDAAQRAAFFAVEARVQAIEALLAEVCGVRFVVSADDFAAPQDDIAGFENAVAAAIVQRRNTGLPARAAALRAALEREFRDD